MDRDKSLTLKCKKKKNEPLQESGCENEIVIYSTLK